MADPRHQRVKELFQRAVHLDREAREQYLQQTCAGDPELLAEVESLLKHHMDKTLIAVAPDSVSPTVPSAPASLRRAADDSPGARTRASAVRGIVRASRGRLAFGAMLLVLLVVYGAWTSSRVQSSLDTLLEDQLQTVLDASATALRQWLAAVETDAQMWADRSTVRAASLALAKLADESADPATALEGSGHLALLVSTLASAVRDPNAVEAGVEPLGGERRESVLLTHRRFDGFGVASASGRILGGYSPGDEAQESLGESMSEGGQAILKRVLQGETVVVPPYETGSMVHGFVPALSKPAMVVVTPVRDEAGVPIALLGLLIEPSEEYSAILEAGRIGETGETYTFNEQGVMLSESAFLDDLRAMGLLAADEPSAVLRVQLRDPGGNMVEGHQPELALADRRRTIMATDAIDRRSSGVNVSGYRDYRGVEVAGAWTWLNEYGIGIATEIDLAEGHAAMRVLRTSLSTLVWGVFILALGLLVFMAKNVGLQADVDLARQYGDYRVVRILGEGGIGTVFLAEHKMFARPAAVKVLRKDRLTVDSELRFQQEVQLSSQLTNPHTVEIYDFGRTAAGEFYYAMEYLPGLTLHELVERFGALPQERVVHIVRQICESLAEAHDLGIIHRDIKPMNILLCERGGRYDVVKVLDFGLVKDMGAPADLQLTQTEQVTGSPLYMAPERFEAPLSVDERADIWAVGCVAYFLLAGRDPFQAKSVMDVWNQVVNDDPPHLRDDLGLDVQPFLAAMVSRCLAKSPDERPQSVHEILSMLQALDMPVWGRSDAQRWWSQRVDELPSSPKIVRREEPA